jgi:hypothetical protein
MQQRHRAIIAVNEHRGGDLCTHHPCVKKINDADQRSSYTRPLNLIPQMIFKRLERKCVLCTVGCANGRILSVQAKIC